MNLKKYEGKEIEIITTAPSTFSSWIEGDGDKKVTVRESNFDNSVSGNCVETSPDSLTVEFDHRGKTFRYECPISCVAMIILGTPNASGLAAAERMKAMHKDSKK